LRGVEGATSMKECGGSLGEEGKEEEDSKKVSF